jgi:phosphomannomutase / phosphoglucomutase
LAVPRLFGTNGIRGVVGQDINTSFAYRLGSSIGVLFPNGQIAVGMDGRVSNVMLRETLVAGLLAQGCEVEDYGLIPTPALEFLVKANGKSGGVMITASHNPPEYNGFKVIDQDGVELAREKEVRVEKLFDRNVFQLRKIPGGRAPAEAAIRDYLRNVRAHFGNTTASLRDITVMVDSGNGVSFLTTPFMLKQLGCRVITVNGNIDGTFPARLSEPRPETLTALADLVKTEKPDFAVAHDGDGDRAIFVDETGEVHWGDRSFALVEDEVLKTNPGAKVVTPLNSSMAVQEIAKKRKGKLILTKVGSIEVSRTMIKNRAILGGEENGGIFYAPHHPVRDGTMAAVLILKAIVKNKLPLSRLISRLPKFPMAKEKYPVNNEEAKHRAMTRLEKRLKGMITSRLDGLKVDVKDKGWVLIRPSGTEQLIRLYAEGKTERDLGSILAEFKPLLQETIR